MPTIVIQDDVVIRTAQVILDPDTDPERQAAIADYFSVDVPDFMGWCDALRRTIPALYPSRVINVADQDGFRAALAEADAAVIEDFAFGADEIEAAPRLRIVHGFRADIRNIDSAACAARGITVKPLYRRVNTAVAEHAFALMLALAKKLCQTNKLLTMDGLHRAGFPSKLYDRRHSAGANWARVANIRNIGGSVLGIIGLGSIGQHVARWAHAFGMEVLYTQRNRLADDVEQRFGARYVGFDELLAASDFISVHVPLNAGTEGMIDRAAFAAMKEGAVLVNISRAAVIDRDALLDALRSGRLGGLGLDVHYKEPADADEPLLAFDNVVLTPHIAVGTRVNGTRDMEELMANLSAAMG